MTLRRIESVFLLGAIAASVLACSAILGLQEPTVDNTIEGGPGNDAGPGSDGTTGDGACNDTTSDTHNCGKCGHDCLGGACSASKCQPVMIAQNQGGPFVVVAQGSSVFWTDWLGSAVMSADKLDGSTNIIASSTNGADQPLGLAADDASVYFANSGFSGTVMRCALGGCPTSSATMFDAGFTNTDLALSTGYTYWLQADGDEIDREVASGGISLNVATTDTGNFGRYLSRIASDGTNVYWSESFNDKIFRKPVSSGAAQTIYTLSSGSQPSALLIDGTTLFFATLGSDNGQGAVSFGALDGTGGAQPLATSQHFPYWLAADATYIYWTTEGDFDTNSKLTAPGGIFRCAKTGCGGNPEQLASNVSDGRGIAVDDRAIYFASFETGNGDGKIWRLAK